MLRYVLLCLLAIFLSACQSAVGKRDSGYNWPYPEKSAAPEDPEAPPSTIGLGPDPDAAGDAGTAIAYAPQTLPDFPRSAEDISGPAVAALLRQAREARAAGQTGQAQGKLERALKIEPRNYFAWAALAACYLDQKNYDQAISVAGKSNSLARGNIYVELENYRVIQQARQALGDSDGAFQAQARADQIQQLLQQVRPDSVSP